jgi:orotate phosphoribosyltransferase
MAVPEHIEERIVVGMYDRGLLAFPAEGVVLKSGRTAPYYYNSRPALSLSNALDRGGQMPIAEQRLFREMLVSAYAAKFLDIGQDVDHVFGKAQAVTAMAAVAAQKAGLSYLWERVDEPNKTYGYHQKIEGNYEPGDRVLLGDDVVTDGKSKIEGMNMLRAVGLEPVAVTLQFDREEGGVQTLEGLGLMVNAVTSLSRAVPYLLDNGRIDTAVIDALQAYHEDLRINEIVSTFQFEG